MDLVPGVLGNVSERPCAGSIDTQSLRDPVGFVGAIAASIGLFTEFTWPYPASFGLASYNIFFGDVTMLFAMVMLVYAAVAYLGLKLEYAGFFGFIAGIGQRPGTGTGDIRPSSSRGGAGLTKDPLETFLLDLAFAAAGGVFSLPAAMVVSGSWSTRGLRGRRSR